jgi:hypothetical protein
VFFMPAPSGSRLAYYAAILLLPAVTLWHQTDPLFSPLWYADTWFYLGYFRDLPNFKADLFRGFYYGSRLSWILPGYVAHSLLPPLTANVLSHLAVHTLATAAVFRILRSSAGGRAAFLTTIFFSANPWVWTATGWDYIAGAAMAYLLSAMACLTAAAEEPDRRWPLMLAGAGLAGAFFAQLFMGVFFPLLLVYYAGMMWARKQPLRQTMIRAARLLGIGFLAATAPICIINGFLLDGDFWFWSPSFRTAGRVVSNYTWTESIWIRGRLSPWLWFFFVAAVLALMFLCRWRDALRRRDVSGLLFSAQFLAVFALMAVAQWRGFTWLAHNYYACYLLPFAFLVFGQIFWQAAEKMRPGTYLLACATALILAGACWCDPFRHPAPGETTWLIAAGVALAVSLVLLNSPASTLLACAGFAALTYGTYDGLDPAGRLHARRDEYERVMNARARIDRERNNSPILFWYDKSEPAYHEYFALNATFMAEFARINEAFPSGCPADAETRTMIAVVSAHHEAPELARTALDRCLSKSHMKVDVNDVFPASLGPNPYEVSLLTTRLDYSGLRPLRAVFGGSPKEGSLELAPGETSLPLNLWKSARGAEQSATSAGVDARTPSDRYAYAFTYPALNVPVSGRYYFVLAYSMRTGHLAFGGFPADESRWLATVKSRSNFARHRQAVFFLDLRQGDTVILRIANDNWYDRSSSFILEGTSVFLEGGA